MNSTATNPPRFWPQALLLLGLLSLGCGMAPEDMESTETELASATIQTQPCVKGQPCGEEPLPVPPSPAPPPRPEGTYCCDSYFISYIVNDKGGEDIYHIEGWGCRNVDPTKPGVCPAGLQITCNNFRVERLDGGHLRCQDPF
jgi:hypothetical protein